MRPDSFKIETAFKRVAIILFLTERQLAVIAIAVSVQSGSTLNNDTMRADQPVIPVIPVNVPVLVPKVSVSMPNC